MLVTDPAGRLFATGFHSSAGALLVTSSDAWFFIDSRYFEAAEKTIAGAHIRLISSEKPLTDQLKALLNEREIKSVGFEDEIVPHAKYLEWTEKLETMLVPARRLIDNLRAVKSPDDLEKMIKAQRVAEKSFEEILPLISMDITEKQLTAELIYRFLLNGADDKSFDPIVVSGAKSSMPHGEPGDVRISAGFLTIDFGVKLEGWCSDTTRTLCIGQPDDEMVKIYDTVLAAQDAGIKAIRAGVPGADVDSAARTVIEDAGYGEYFGHGFGHSLGLEVHESVTASPLSEDTLVAGVVLSAEPGIYIPGRYGVRIEDVVYVTETGCENITNIPKDLMILGGT